MSQATPIPEYGDYGAIIFDKPYMRAQPYLLGILAAYFYVVWLVSHLITRHIKQFHVDHATRPFRLSGLQLVLGWMFVLALMLLVLFGLSGQFGVAGFASRCVNICVQQHSNSAE